jgi:hypothetical protein
MKYHAEAKRIKMQAKDRFVLPVVLPKIVAITCYH